MVDTNGLSDQKTNEESKHDVLYENGRDENINLRSYPDQDARDGYLMNVSLKIREETK